MSAFNVGDRVRNRVPVQTDSGLMQPPGTLGMVIGGSGLSLAIVTWDLIGVGSVQYSTVPEQKLTLARPPSRGS